MAKVCVVGSGAGAGPIIYEMAKAGHEVVVLEKGPWIRTEQMVKDEVAVVRKSVFKPNLKDEKHVIEELKSGKWKAQSTFDSGKTFWNGSAVGGSSNFMSGFFHRMRPNDFKLLSTYGPIDGANIVDWPISYEDLEPYYAKVESVVGVSGKVTSPEEKELRSTPDYPYPALGENPVGEMLESTAREMGYNLEHTPRAILSRRKENRKPCYYSNFCGGYGCASDAKGSSRAALIKQVAEQENCTVIPNAKVFYLETNGNHKITKAWYYDKEDQQQVVEADIFVVACQAIETSRLLLMSVNTEYPNGLANSSGQVGKNLLFAGGGAGSGSLHFSDFDEEMVKNMKLPGLFVNRCLKEWYEIEDESFGGRVKGGVVDFIWEHANAISKAGRQKWQGRNEAGDKILLYGKGLKEKVHYHFTQQRRMKFEIFADWLPNDHCFVGLDGGVKDKWGDPVAKVRLFKHNHSIEVSRYIANRAYDLMKKMGAKQVTWNVTGGPPKNLQAGGCRFGDDPQTSVLDKNCKAHDVDNLYVTDGSFIPTGGSATYTWTIYANSFRVADHLLERLS